eukprot:3338127-Pyramimonas_sp.AAC.1
MPEGVANLAGRTDRALDFKQAPPRAFLLTKRVRGWSGDDFAGLNNRSLRDMRGPQSKVGTS